MSGPIELLTSLPPCANEPNTFNYCINNKILHILIHFEILRKNKNKSQSETKLNLTLRNFYLKINFKVTEFLIFFFFFFHFETTDKKNLKQIEYYVNTAVRICKNEKSIAASGGSEFVYKSVESVDFSLLIGGGSSSR